MFWIAYDIIFLWYHMPMIWCHRFYIYDIIPLLCMISVFYDIIGLWYHSQFHMQNHIWYHGIKTMISYFWIYDISNLWYHRPCLWYHNQYHIQNHIWYHEIKTMISYFRIYDISNVWYHPSRSMISYKITSMISPMISQSIPTLTQICKQMISMYHSQSPH